MSCFTDARLGRMIQVLAAKETTYGVLASFAAASPLLSMASTCEMTPTINTTEVNYKTGTKLPQLDETVKTTTGGTVVLSGAFNDKYEWLLEAYTGDAATPFVMSETLNPSYEIHRQHTDTTAKDDIALGCVCESLNFTAAQNGLLMFEATFNAQSITWEAATEGTWVAPTIKPFQFAGSSLTDSSFTVTALTSYACNLAGTMLDDDVSFGSAVTKVCNGKLAYTGEVTYESLYLQTDEMVMADQTSGTTSIAATFLNGEAGAGTSTIVLTTTGKFAREAADPDNGLFKQSLTQTLAGAAPLSVTYATA